MFVIVARPFDKSERLRVFGPFVDEPAAEEVLELAQGISDSPITGYLLQVVAVESL